MKESAFVVELKPKEIFRNFDENAISGLNYKQLCMLDKIQVFKELSFEETKELVEEKIKTTTNEEAKDELLCLINELENETVDILDEKKWFAIIKKIGEAGELSYKIKDSNLQDRFLSCVKQLNQKFQTFIDSKYESLFTRSGLKYPYTILGSYQNNVVADVTVVATRTPIIPQSLPITIERIMFAMPFTRIIVRIL